MKVHRLTIPEKDSLTGVKWNESSYFNPIQDDNGDWIISEEEGLTLEESLSWVGELPKINYVREALYSLISNLNTSTQTISLWLSGNEDIDIEWYSGSTLETINLTKTLTEYTHTYTGETPNIRITNKSNISEFICSTDNTFSLTIDSINSLKGIKSFINIGSVITGDVGSLTLDTLELLNLGDQIDNTSLTGNICNLINNNSKLKDINITGGNLTVSDIEINVLDGSNIYLKDNNIDNSEVDILINRSILNDPNIELSIIGDNGYRTFSSNSSISQHETNGSTIITNGIPIGSATYTNSELVIETGIPIDDQVVTFDNDPTPDFEISTDGVLPAGLNLNSSNGTISGTSTETTNGLYSHITRFRAFGDTYTGHADAKIDFHLIANYIENLRIENLTHESFNFALEGYGSSYFIYQSHDGGLTYSTLNAFSHEGSLGETQNSQTISGLSPNTEYLYRLRAITSVGLSADFDIAVTTEVDPATLPKIYKVNVAESTAVGILDGEHWNNLLGLNGSITGLVDVDGNSSSINISMSNPFIFDGNTGGRGTNSNFPSEPALSYAATNGADSTVDIEGLDNSKVYDIIPLSSRSTNNGNRVGEFTVAGETLSLDAELNPPQTVSFLGKSPTSNLLTLNLHKPDTSNSVFLNLFVIIEYP